MFPMNIASIKMATDKGIISISRVKNGQAYDQDGDQIPSSYFKVFPHILSMDWDRQAENTNLLTV